MADRPQSAAWVAAFDGQRPPFAPGNQVARGNRGPVTHGAQSPRLVEPLAAEFIDALLADDAVPYLREPRYRPAVAAWAQAEARLVLLERWCASMPITKAATAPAGRTPPLEMLRKADAAALTHRRELGLTPMAAARLGRDVAQTRAADTAAVMAELHRQEQAAREVQP